MKRIFFYRSKCLGCSYCSLVAPDQWVMDSRDGRSNLFESKEIKGIFTTSITTDEVEANEEAANLCPVGAIKIES